jgi:hypothetical protein
MSSARKGLNLNRSSSNLACLMKALVSRMNSLYSPPAAVLRLFRNRRCSVTEVQIAYLGQKGFAKLALVARE